MLISVNFFFISLIDASFILKMPVPDGDEFSTLDIISI
jgi:hypothetical protein